MALPPHEFLERMKLQLGPGYPSFREAYEKPPFRGIRINPLKCGEETLKGALPFSLSPSPFSPLSFYMPRTAEKIGYLPMHHAGAFYAQEPSASSAVTALNPQPGETVLDLCAAPGGKSTQIAALLGGEGLLWSNEIVRSRANILLSNLERMGARNAVVSCCHPEKLCAALAGFFDRVLVDAPCSGEGLFRREEQAVREWSPQHVEACAVRQLAILGSACAAVKENGTLVYSTCTFSETENESVVSAFLKRHPGFELTDIPAAFGRPARIEKARRIYPMDGGEGHFVAAMRRKSENPSRTVPFQAGKMRAPELSDALCRDLFTERPSGVLVQIRESFYLLPEGLPELSGLGVLRAGVKLGTVKGKRTEPAHAVFMASRPGQLRNVLLLAHDSPEIAAFLRGEEIDSKGGTGYTGVAVDGVLTGFGKTSQGRLKNHYPKGLRNLR